MGIAGVIRRGWLGGVVGSLDLRAVVERLVGIEKIGKEDIGLVSAHDLHIDFTPMSVAWREPGEHRGKEAVGLGDIRGIDFDLVSSETEVIVLGPNLAAFHFL